MADKRRLNLSFSMALPHHRKAWSILRAVPSGQRTDAVCRMVCKAQDQDVLLANIRNVIREELRNADLTARKTENDAQAGDVDEHVLDFLRTLQEGDDMF